MYRHLDHEDRQPVSRKKRPMTKSKELNFPYETENDRIVNGIVPDELTEHKPLKLQYNTALDIIAAAGGLSKLTKTLVKNHSKFVKRHKEFKYLEEYTEDVKKIVRNLERQVKKVTPKDFVAVYTSPGGWRVARFHYDPDQYRHVTCYASETAYSAIEEARKVAKQWAREKRVQYKSEVFRMDDDYPYTFRPVSENKKKAAAQPPQ